MSLAHLPSNPHYPTPSSCPLIPIPGEIRPLLQHLSKAVQCASLQQGPSQTPEREVVPLDGPPTARAQSCPCSTCLLRTLPAAAAGPALDQGAAVQARQTRVRLNPLPGLWWVPSRGTGSGCAPATHARTRPAAAGSRGPAAFGRWMPTPRGPRARAAGCAAPRPPGAGRTRAAPASGMRWLGSWGDRKDGEEVGEGFLR